MAKSRAVIEAQIQKIDKFLDLRTKLLVQRKIESKAQLRDAILRKQKAEKRKLTAQLNRVNQIEALNVEMARLKAEKAAQPKVKKEKKKAAAPAPDKKAKAKKKA